MKSEYSPEINALYVEFTSGRSHRQQALNETTRLDFGEQGNVMGIELLNVSEQVANPTKIDFEFISNAVKATSAKGADES